MVRKGREKAAEKGAVKGPRVASPPFIVDGGGSVLELSALSCVKTHGELKAAGMSVLFQSSPAWVGAPFF